MGGWYIVVSRLAGRNEISTANRSKQFLLWPVTVAPCAGNKITINASRGSSVVKARPMGWEWGNKRGQGIVQGPGCGCGCGRTVSLAIRPNLPKSRQTHFIFDPQKAEEPTSWPCAPSSILLLLLCVVASGYNLCPPQKNPRKLCTAPAFVIFISKVRSVRLAFVSTN